MNILSIKLVILSSFFEKYTRVKTHNLFRAVKQHCSMFCCPHCHDRNLRLSYSGKSRLAWISRACAEQLYWRNARGYCVIIKNVILTLLAWMSLHVTSQQTTPSVVHGRDFAWPPVVATFLSNFQSCHSCQQYLTTLLSPN